MAGEEIRSWEREWRGDGIGDGKGPVAAVFVWLEGIEGGDGCDFRREVVHDEIG